MMAAIAAVIGHAPGVSLLHNSTTGSSSAFNATLTTYGQGIALDLSKVSLASWICPWVVTYRAQGQYKQYKDKEAFAIYSTLRGEGDRTRVAFDTTDPYFNCLPNGLEIPTPAFMQEQGGVGGDGWNVRKARVRTMVNAAYRSRERTVFTQLRAGKAATGSVGNWSSDSVDPIDEIDGEIAAIAGDTGLMPNRLLIPLAVWKRIRSHPKVLARKAGVNSSGLSLGEFAAMLLNPAIEVKIGLMPYDTAARGKTVSKANIYATDVWIWYAEDAPDEMDASFAKCFSVSGAGLDSVNSYIEKGNIAVDYIDWSEVSVVTAPLSGRRIAYS